MINCVNPRCIQRPMLAMVGGLSVVTFDSQSWISLIIVGTSNR